MTNLQNQVGLILSILQGSTNKDKVCVNLNETIMNDSHSSSDCTVTVMSSKPNKSSKRVYECDDVGEKTKNATKRHKSSSSSENSLYKVLQAGQKAKDTPSVFDGWFGMSITQLVNLVLTESGFDTRAEKGNPLLKNREGAKPKRRNEFNEIRKCLRLIGFCIKSDDHYKMFTKQVTIPRPGTEQRNLYIQKCKAVSNKIAQDICVELKAKCTRERHAKNYNSMKILLQYVKKTQIYPWPELNDQVDPNDENSKPILSWELVNDKERV